MGGDSKNGGTKERKPLEIGGPSRRREEQGRRDPGGTPSSAVRPWSLPLLSDKKVLETGE